MLLSYCETYTQDFGIVGFFSQVDISCYTTYDIKQNVLYFLIKSYYVYLVNII